MKTHSSKGREIIDIMLQNFGLDALQHIEILRNITEYHHESMDGSGYPNGLKKDEIPLEARIVAVADVFDALTSRRSYKDAWSIDEAFALLIKMSGTKLDRECVDALVKNRIAVDDVQNQFREDKFG